MREFECAKCKVVKPETDFSPSRRKPGTYCRSCVASYEKARRDEKYTPLEQKVQKICWRYGITSDEWYAMLIEQNGRCAICSEELLDKLHLDHNEETGQVRALLFGPCNRGIGMFKHDENLLLAAAAYIMQHKPVETETRRTN